MKRLNLLLSLALVVLAGVINADDLSYPLSVRYDVTTSGSPRPYGLFIRGCGIYTTDDYPAQGFGIPNHVLRFIRYDGDTTLPADTVVDVGEGPSTDAFGYFHQRIFVDDWFEDTTRSYEFCGRGGANGLVSIFRVQDSGACTIMALGDSCLGHAVFNQSISVWDEKVYVSTVGYTPDGALVVMDFDPDTGVLSRDTITYVGNVYGAWQYGDQVMVAAADTSATMDTLTFLILDASDPTSVVDQMVVDGGNFSLDAGGDFKIIADSFTVSSTTSKRTIGVFGVHNQLIIVDLTDDDVDLLYSSLDTPDSLISTSEISDLALLDGYLFMASADTNSWDPEISVWDISSPESPSRLVSLRASDAYTNGDDGAENVIDAGYDYVWDGAAVLQVARERVWNDSSNFWDATGNYTIFTNWTASDGDSIFAFVHEFVFEPTSPTHFIVGDVNGSNSMNILDVNAISAYLSGNTTNYEPVARYDINGDGLITPADNRHLVWYLFGGGDKPGRFCNDCP